MRLEPELFRSAVAMAIDAALTSPEECKIGAILIRPGARSQYVLGHNISSNRAIENMCDAAKDRHLKLHDGRPVMHAERNVILKAKEVKYDVNDSVLIVVGKCVCSECAEEVVEAGIKTVFCPPPDENSRWVSSNRVGLALLEAAGVEVVQMEMLKGIEHGLTLREKYEAKTND